ncbi:tetratricopeptide repeat protein [Desulfurobacterium sp.]|uniref:tetratricopeptide repeat protein n=1 Tax=Desulfurobacterium sp. TaxID=2004706 RepID=UPI00260A024C|nr:tetratricopeptide repeat protein [Desulfurobacterium sp.]
MRLTLGAKIKKLTISMLIILITVFPLAAHAVVNNTTPIDQYLKKIEEDISKGENIKKINEEIKRLMEIKDSSSIFYLPEINYITGEKFENVPPSSADKIREKIIKIDIGVSTATVGIVILSIFTLIYASDRLFSSEAKRNIAVFIGTILIICGLIFQNIPFYLIFAAIAGLGLRFKEKIPFSIAMIFLLLLHTWGVGAEKGYFNYISNPKNLLYVKLNRDNYAPPFLIGKAPANMVKIASIANKQALLHKVDTKKLKDLAEEVRDRKIKAILYNNLGCVAFQKGNLKKAINLFKKAEGFYPMVKTYYNLFLTYSSLLQPQEAEAYSKKLEEANFSFNKTIPLIANISDIGFPKPDFSIPIYSLIAIVVGTLLGLTAMNVKKTAALISINPFFSYLPGYRLYYANRYSALFLLLGAIMALEIIIGSMLCSMNL